MTMISDWSSMKALSNWNPIARIKTIDVAHIEFWVISVRYFVILHDAKMIKCKMSSSSRNGKGTNYLLSGYCLSSQLAPSEDFSWVGGHSDKHSPFNRESPIVHLRQIELSSVWQRSHPYKHPVHCLEVIFVLVPIGHWATHWVPKRNCKVPFAQDWHFEGRPSKQVAHGL